MNRWEFVPKMQSRNITLYAHLVTWNYTLRPFGLPIKKIKLGDVQKPQDQKDENDYKRWFVPKKSKTKIYLYPKKSSSKFFTQQFLGWGETTLWRYSHRSRPPLNAYPPDEVDIRWWTSWDPRWYPNKTKIHGISELDHQRTGPVVATQTHIYMV